ncbi:MAG: Rne/Rng family ribonuclease [Fibromonadaceae bacterium]|jgi:ribonuclease G|nr:Rne/Rng family ribonuclease [Fibromonadaceae bacterium]
MQKSKAAKRGILVSSTPYDTRIAVLDDGVLTDLLVENSTSNRSLGNIYKGVVQRVVPALQAAFVEVGMEKAGFLHINDAIDRDALLRKEYGEDENSSHNSYSAPSIEKVLKPGDEIMVQVIKEPINTKGARLTTHLSFAERFLVCMPKSNFIGISKKERDFGKRKLFKQIVHKHKASDVGYIVRTQALIESEMEIVKQMRKLEEKWEITKNNFNEFPAERCIYQESNSVEQSIREYFSEWTEYVYVDDESEYQNIRDYLGGTNSESLQKIKLWRGQESLFEAFGVEDDYEKSLSTKVYLPRGAYLVIEQTEALMSIDVNTGSRVHGSDQSRVFLETNLDAAREIAKQLRLRDVGGLVVIDFIDMETEDDKNAVVDEFRKAIRFDRTPLNFSAISQFGLMEVSRRRVRTNLASEKHSDCPMCGGTGIVFSMEATLSLIDRYLARIAKKSKMKSVQLVISSPLAKILSDDYGRMFHYLEHKYSLNIELLEAEDYASHQFSFLNPETGEDITEKFAFNS